jgi:hypothetical protein
MVVGLGLTPKSFNSGMKSFLNSLPLSNKTFCGWGYLLNLTLLNNCEIQADDLSSGTSAISNHPVAGSMNVIAVKDFSILFLVVTL